MKTLGILCVLAAFAPFAFADDKSAISTTSTTVTTKKSLKESWPASKAACRKAQKTDGVPNFGKLNDLIWRSGQPSADGYKNLAAQGLKTVVNLREEFPQDKDRIPQGVKYVYIPIKDEHEPTPEQAKQFMEIASNSDNWPLLVHCHGGEGRAGVMSALVRHTFDGWNHDMIMEEVRNFRSSHLFGIKTPMASCQQKFIQTWETTPGMLAKEVPGS